jgi:hypothetical protein
VRVLAFHFGDEASARHVLEVVRDTVAVPSGSSAIAPAAVENAPGGVLLGLSVSPERAAFVRSLAASHGGRMVADVPSEWTHSRSRVL